MCFSLDAKHLPTGTSVAIKMIDMNSIKNSRTMSDKINREIKFLTRLKHPHVVKVFEAFQVKNLLYVVMEYLPKGELFDLIAKFGKV